MRRRDEILRVLSSYVCAEKRVGGVIILSSASESYFHGDYTITYSVELWP